MRILSFILICILPFLLYSQDLNHFWNDEFKVNEKFTPENKIALVIANTNYNDDKLDLKNPTNDAKLMGDSFTKLGFNVSIKENLDKNQIYAEMDSFKEGLEKNDFGILYYAGHAVQHSGADSYLLPVDYLSKSNVEVNGVNISELVLYFENSNNKCLIILDACRNSDNNGLSKPSIEDPINIKLAYSTSFGKTASDNTDLDNTIYSYYLSKLFLIDGLSINNIFHNASKKVLSVTNKKQYPVDYFGITIEEVILNNSK